MSLPSKLSLEARRDPLLLPSAIAEDAVGWSWAYGCSALRILS